ncbi:hypothetical protein BCR35DRAFT_299656 [Leucosporidium creatinivorum]|uniref:Uncharacterized protein n=1 Tax=Leucosporidium creatinivorum TaxID=106004 RepID=A0A1Y2G265_9BASI|nr:hypothetical protein BCR35DRAFT_299656 [Leucosporidium creatinivorum]
MSKPTTPLNFAPYSDPPPLLPTTRPHQPVASTSSAPYPSTSSSSYQAGFSPSRNASATSTGQAISGLETTLHYDLGLLGAAAYALGPVGAALLLVREVENDWVRFQAWQSALLSGILLLFDLLVHLLFGSVFLNWILILSELGLLGLLSRRAYMDADLLDRLYLPWIGEVAERWVAEE